MGDRPADITIVGLGSGGEAGITSQASGAIASASRVFVRSHPGFDDGGLGTQANVTDLSVLVDTSRSLSDRWNSAAIAVCDGAAEGPVVLAIPGHPRFGEGLVLKTIREAELRGLTTRVIDGISVVDLVATALGVDPLLEGVQLFNARTIALIVAQAPFEGGVFTGSPSRPMLFTHVYDTAVCASLHALLGRLYPPGHPMIQVEAAGTPNQATETLSIGDLATLPGGPLVALWVPPLAELDAGADPRTMQHIVARLRAPDGCPWDRKQDHASLARNMVDEVYEAVDAIERADMANLAEELGDLFLLILMQAQIAHEHGDFSIEDVYEGIARKIVGRHPHVFGDEAAANADDVIGIWQQVKAKERAASGKTSGKDADGEPFSMPALTRAARVLKKHPLIDDDHSPPLLREVAAILARGEDPDKVLKEQLRAHVQQVS